MAEGRAGAVGVGGGEGESGGGWCRDGREGEGGGRGDPRVGGLIGDGEVRAPVAVEAHLRGRASALSSAEFFVGKYQLTVAAVQGVSSVSAGGPPMAVEAQLGYRAWVSPAARRAD